MKTIDEKSNVLKMPYRLFVDMDGTLAKFTAVDKIETLYEEGYFFNLEPQKNVIDAVKKIMKTNPEIEVYILSAVLSDSQYAKKEKNEWLDKYLPNIDDKHRIYPQCGVDKKSVVPGGVKTTDYLLDDYTKNLSLWSPPGTGIKLINGINHTNGTWQQSKLDFSMPPEILKQQIIGIINNDELNQLGYYNMTETEKNNFAMAYEYALDMSATDGLTSTDEKIYEAIMNEQKYTAEINLTAKCWKAFNSNIYPTFTNGTLAFNSDVFTGQERETLQKWYKLPDNYELDNEKSGIVLAHKKLSNGTEQCVTWQREATGGVCFGHYYNEADAANKSAEDFATRVAANNISAEIVSEAEI